MKSLFHLLTFAGLFVFTHSVAAQATYADAPIVNVSAVEAQEVLKQKDIVILDIRTPQEFRASRISGAININFYDPSFPDELNKLDRNKTYFVYCRSGNRTGQSMRLFSQLGFKNIFHLQRGIVDWTRSGYKMINE
jgi:rhodanese-related sulfurtransferase